MALSTKTKLGIGGSIVMLGIAAYLIYAYKKNMFPFTPEFKAKLKSMMGGGPQAQAPPVPTVSPTTLTGTVTNFLGQGATDNLTPPAGTGAVSLNSGALTPYDTKGDPTINTVYQQELYKQLFLPYDQYPYLYDENYRQSLTKPQDPNAPFDPASLVYGYRPPIQGGDVPPDLTATTGSQQQLLDYLAKNYGLFPPGGGATPYDSQYFTPGQGQGLPSNMACMNDAQGIMYCQSPSQTSIDCKQVMGYWFCPMNKPITDPTTTTPAQPPSANKLCFDYQNNTYCESATQTGQDCMNIDNKYYCPTKPVPQGPGVTPNCFVQQGFTYCESPSQTSINCQQLAGKWYCPTQTGSTDCFTDSTGKHYCVSLTPSDPACMNISGKWYCPDTPTPAATIPTEDDSTKPPPGDPCFNSGGTPYCYSTVKTRDDCMSVAGYWYCPYTVGGGPVTPQTGITPDCPSGYTYNSQYKVCTQNQQPTSPAPGTLPSGYSNPSCAPQYCGNGGQWDYNLCRCVPIPTPSTTPNPTPQPAPAPDYCLPQNCGATGDWDFNLCRCVARATSPTVTPTPGAYNCPTGTYLDTATNTCKPVTSSTPPPSSGGPVVITGTPYPSTPPPTTTPPSTYIPPSTTTPPPTTTTPPPTTTPPAPVPPTCAPIGVSKVTASADDGNVPSNVIDGNGSSRWSCSGKGCYITLDLGSSRAICSIDIAWYQGNTRRNAFIISTSAGTTGFTTVYSGNSSGSSASFERYTLPANTKARSIRITVNGNTVNDWASITEVSVNGGSATASMAHAYQGRYYAANRAQQLRNQAHQEHLAAMVMKQPTKRPVQASIRSWYTPDVILA